MSAPTLLELLPDLVLLLRRDGVVLDCGGGRDVGSLQPGPGCRGQPLESAWPQELAQALRTLARKALVGRGSARIRLQHEERRYDVRASAQGPERVLVVVRLLGALAAGGQHLDRRGFMQRFKESFSWAALREKPAAVALIHIDGLADISQAIDARVAEQLLSAAIARLPATPPTDSCGGYYLGQLSDHLLAVVLESADRDQIAARLVGLCASLREPIALGDAVFHLSPHAGVAILGRDGASPRLLLDHARAAVTQARRSDSRSPTFFSDTLKLRSLARLDVTRELRSAIDNGDVRLHYTGRHDLRGGDLTAWMGYLRWLHPLRGEIRPLQFLRVAETTGLSTALSRAVLHCLSTDFATLSTQHAEARLSFGALHYHILQEDFLADITHLVTHGAVPPQRLELRISEKTFLARDPTIFGTLHELGVQLVVDEVGRGMGSLDALARAPIFGLQLDRSWVTALRADAVALKVCRAAIHLAAGLGLQPIATGVDDEEQRRALLELGCRYGSGDLYRAVPNITRQRRTTAI